MLKVRNDKKRAEAINKKEKV